MATSYNDRKVSNGPGRDREVLSRSVSISTTEQIRFFTSNPNNFSLYLETLGELVLSAFKSGAQAIRIRANDPTGDICLETTGGNVVNDFSSGGDLEVRSGGVIVGDKITYSASGRTAYNLPIANTTLTSADGFAGNKVFTFGGDQTAGPFQITLPEPEAGSQFTFLVSTAITNNDVTIRPPSNGTLNGISSASFGVQQGSGADELRCNGSTSPACVVGDTVTFTGVDSSTYLVRANSVGNVSFPSFNFV